MKNKINHTNDPENEKSKIIVTIDQEMKNWGKKEGIGNKYAFIHSFKKSKHKWANDKNKEIQKGKKKDCNRMTRKRK